MRETLAFLLLMAGAAVGVWALWSRFLDGRRPVDQWRANHRLDGRMAAAEGTLAVSGALNGARWMVLAAGFFTVLFTWWWLTGRPVRS